jgi:hypothetical protein
VRRARTQAAACNAGAQAVDVEARAEDAIDAALQHPCRLIPAQISQCERVISPEAMHAERELSAHEIIVDGEGARKRAGHVLHAGSHVFKQSGISIFCIRRVCGDDGSCPNALRQHSRGLRLESLREEAT